MAHPEDHPLVVAGVRASVEHHATVTPRLLDDPLDEVDRVDRVIERLTELPTGIPSSTHVGDDVGEPTGGEVLALTMS